MPPTMDYTGRATGLLESLQNIRRRVKVFGVAYGVGVVVACAVALVLAAVLIDWALALPRPLRVLVNLGAVVALGYALLRWVARPALSRLSLTDLAGRLENVFPQFDDSLRSTVNFVVHDIPGSEAMKQRTVVKATELAERVDLNRAVELRPVWYSAAAGIGAVLALVLLASLVDPGFRRIAAHRLFGGAEAWPKSVEIDVLSTVPQRVAVGQNIDVRARLKKGTAKRAILHYRYDDGRWEQEVMDRADDGTFTSSLAARLEANRDSGRLQIRIEAGDDDQSLAPVTVVPRLDIRGVTALVTPPAYAHLAATPVAISERPVVTVLGSEVELQVAFNKGLDQAKGIRLVPSDPSRKAPEVKWAYPASGQAAGRFVLADAFKPNDPFRFIIRATDVDGFENTGSQEYQIIVHDDAMPSVTIDLPKRNEERTPDATVPIRAVAEDDYGIDAAELVVRGVSPSIASKAWTIPLLQGQTVADGAGWSAADSTTERKRFKLEYQWNLAKLDAANLKPGDQLEFMVRVKDNFDFNGQQHPFVESGRLRITIISHEQDDTQNELVLANERQIIAQIKKVQDVNNEETKSQAQETASKGKYDDAQRATVGRLANQQSTATAQAKQAADRLKDLVQRMTENKAPEKGAKEAAKDVAGQLDRTAEGPMKQAAGELNQAKDNKADPKAGEPQQKANAQQSSQQMQNSSQNQGEASRQLEQAMNKLNDFGGLTPAIEKIKDIKDRQAQVAKDYKDALKKAIGKDAKDLTPEEKAKLKDLVEKQNELAQQTDKALKDMESKADRMSKSDPAGSKAMKEAAQTGQQTGIPQKQSNPKDNNGASQEMEQNQQANAQQKHKEIDLGLEMILNKLKEAEQRKLAQLQRDLAEMQKLIGELIARQAGHNIDNLLLQDPKKVTDMTQEARDNLFELAGREQAKLVEMKPELAVLTPSQEQTERNCRDFAKKAEPLPDPAVASKLTQAAAKMEQAIVFLRKSQLADAYQPPQVEALVALVEAHKAVSEMKQKADDEAEQNKEESIKQAYVKMLEAQQKLDKDTLDIDASERDADGNLKRDKSIRLGALPGEQGKLADDAKKIGERLQTLKSVVYIWANKDIVSSMDEVKGDLAKPETGKVTQAEQARIEEQLQSMIDNLAKKQERKKKDFAGARNGGGSGKGQKPPPKMPTDIELRLLKDLQIAVNKNTKVIDAEVRKNNGKKDEKDGQKLLSLGTRQGELRGLLDGLLKQASEGKITLGKEPDPKDQLPEEADKGAIEDDEFTKALLADNLQADTVEKSIKLTGDRMARSRRRLAPGNDPGAVTQEIQKRIVDGMDDLIKLAQQQQQQAQAQPKPGDKPGEKGNKPQPGDNQGPQQANGKPQDGHQENGTNAATDSSLTQGGDPQTDASRDLQSKLDEWGHITPRAREAVMEGRSEKALSKYDQFIKDYYREVAKKAAER